MISFGSRSHQICFIIQNMWCFARLMMLRYHLHNLKNIKNTLGGVLLLVKLQTPPWVFSRFLYIVQTVPNHPKFHIYKSFHLKMVTPVWNSISQFFVAIQNAASYVTKNTLCNESTSLRCTIKANVQSRFLKIFWWSFSAEHKTAINFMFHISNKCITWISWMFSTLHTSWLDVTYELTFYWWNVFQRHPYWSKRLWWVVRYIKRRLKERAICLLLCVIQKMFQ